VSVLQDNQIACLRVKSHNGTFAILKDIIRGLHLDCPNLAHCVLNPIVQVLQPLVDLSEDSKYLVEYAKKVHSKVHQHQEDEGPPKSRLRLRILNEVIKQEAEPQGYQECALIHELNPIQIQSGEGSHPEVED
jgi:hypothetical protein